MRFSRLLIGAILSSLPACEDTGEGDSFTIEASLEDNTCGAGAVEASETVETAVRLTISGDTLVWRGDDGGTPLSGLVEDGEFSIAETDTFTLIEGTEHAAGCIVQRLTRYEGTIEESAGRITDVSGSILFRYAEAVDHDCDALVGAEGGFENLPCEVTYGFTAQPR